MSNNQELEQVIKTANSEITRNNKAEKLIDCVSIFNNSTASVQSPSGNIYEVNFIEGKCDCLDHKTRKVECKHIKAVNLFIVRLTQRGNTN